jgi:hypothetical protein
MRAGLTARMMGIPHRGIELEVSWHMRWNTR